MTEHFRTKGYMRFLTIFLGFVALVDQYLSLIETAVNPFILTEFNMNLSELVKWQGIVGLFAFFVFVISWLGDHYGRKIGMFILILTMSVPALLIGLIGTTSFFVFIILYGIMIMGANVNFWSIPIAEESPKNKRGQNGSIVFLIGLIPLYALFGITISNNLGWQWAYGLMGIFGLFTLILLYFMKETKRWQENQDEFKQSKKTLVKSMKLFTKSDWKFIGISGFVYICWSSAFKFVSLTLAVYFIKVQGKTEAEWDSILTLGGLMTLVGAITIGLIMEKLGRVIAFVWSIGGSIIAYTGLALTGLPIFAISIYYFMSSVLGYLLVYNAEMLPTTIRATGIGILSTIARIGFVLGPLLISVLLPNEVVNASNLSDFKTLYLTGAGIMTLAFATLLLNHKETKGKSLEEIVS